MITTLGKELVLRKNELHGETVESIYFGGGTPSLLETETLQFLTGLIYDNYEVSDNAEISLEANPDDLNKNKIIELSKSSVNRLSIGIQSFFDQDLQMMNRAHNSAEAQTSLTLATRYFDNITIDLIYGIPKMTNARWKKNLQKAFEFGVNHISSYALTVEPKTALAAFIKQGKVPDVSEESALEHFKILVSETEKQGFVHYEISNFGKPEYFSKHNISYWSGDHYLGIGPSAHSYNGKQRSWNVSNNIKYLKAFNENRLAQEIEKLSEKDKYNEAVMTGLRTIWGVSIEHIEQEFGPEYKAYLLENSKKFIDLGLLSVSETEASRSGSDFLKVTKQGKFLSDGIAAELFMI
jgi:oxygen-independent coproporphyrinogen-3 oxidase